MREILQRQYVDRGRLYVTINEFCDIVGITDPTFFKMRQLGLAPRETRLPGIKIVRFEVEEVDRWMTAHAHPSKGKRAILDEEKAKLKQASVAANSRQLHRPNHKAKNGDAADTPPDIPRKRKKVQASAEA